MTDKTPIEKAAEEVSSLSYELMKVANLPMDAKEIADIIRRRLEKEVPEKRARSTISPNIDKWARLSHNQCRRDIGLRDDTEEA